MPIDQILKQNWDPNLKGKRTSSSAPPPQTQQQQLRDSKTLPLVPEHIGNGEIGSEIRDCLGLESSTCCRGITPQGISVLSLFLYLMILISAVLWEWDWSSLFVSLCTEKWLNEILFVTLSLVLWNWIAFTYNLIAFIWHFDFIGLWICRFVYCECFIFL